MILAEFDGNRIIQTRREFRWETYNWSHSHCGFTWEDTMCADLADDIEVNHIIATWNRAAPQCEHLCQGYATLADRMAVVAMLKMQTEDKRAFRRYTLSQAVVTSRGLQAGVQV